jgi:hypothetical protein
MPYAETQDAHKQRVPVVLGAFDIPITASRNARPTHNEPENAAMANIRLADVRSLCIQQSGRQHNLIAQNLLRPNYPEFREANLSRVWGVDHERRCS